MKRNIIWEENRPPPHSLSSCLYLNVYKSIFFYWWSVCDGDVIIGIPFLIITEWKKTQWQRTKIKTKQNTKRKTCFSQLQIENFYWKILVGLTWIVCLSLGKSLCTFEWGSYLWPRRGFVFTPGSGEAEYLSRERWEVAALSTQCNGLQKSLKTCL